MSAAWIRTAIIPDEVDFVDALRRAVSRGFTHIEIAAMEERPAEHLEALADTGLFVASVRLGGGLDDEDVETRRTHLARMKRMTGDAARLGATMAILTQAGTDERGRAYFLEACEMLASFASARGVQLAVLITERIVNMEPSGQDATGVSHPCSTPATLLALDSPGAEDIRRAGERLGYVRRPDATALAVLMEEKYSRFVAIDIQGGLFGEGEAW